MMRRTSKDFLPKALTGIEGLDEITRGGLPRGRTTLLVGGPGSGKTILALQILVNGARRGTPGIFVALEENSRRLITNMASFGWNLPTLEKRELYFLDAQPSPDQVQAGGFDLQGMLAALDAKLNRLKARFIVFDSLDVLLSLLDDPASERREINRLHEWLLARELTAVITAKAHDTLMPGQITMAYLQFMVDCVISLNHDVQENISQRSMRVLKFRGSAFSENTSPMLIGPNGIEIAGVRGEDNIPIIYNERISTGVQRLDAMLQGGYFRGSSILITGSPGTAKTTLSGSFAEAACKRGERTLIVSFDTDKAEIVRNLTSVGIRLERYVRTGKLQIYSGRVGESSAEIHLLNIRSLIRANRVRNLVIDPVSALGKAGNAEVAHSVVERLIDWAKAGGVTVVCTSLLPGHTPESEGTPLQISTIADVWIHLSYVINSGERNRALSIIKARGTAHSNQVRELVLHKQGVTLSDVYTTDGQVLMGTLRWQKEQAERTEQARLKVEAQRRLSATELELDEIRGRAFQLQRALEIKKAELNLLLKQETDRRSAHAVIRNDMRQLRQGDVVRNRKQTQQTKGKKL